MKGRVFFIIIALALIFSYSADGAEINSNIFLPDGMGNLYKVESAGGNTEVFKISPKESKKYLVSGDKFDKAFCIDGEIYLTSNRERFIYIVAKDRAEIAEISLERDYSMTADEKYFYFCDSSKAVKYDFGTGKSENINAEDFPKPLESDKDIYVLEGNKIYMLDEGKKISEYISDSGISEIILSGENLYGIMHEEAIYIPKSAFKKMEESKTEESKMEVSQKSKPVKQEVSRNDEISKAESKAEISVSEKSKVSEPSMKEPSVSYYGISSDVYEISEDMIYIPQGTSVSDFKKGMKYGDCKVSFINHNGKSVTSGNIGTGWRVNFSGSGNITDYYTVVSGDVTGEGNINSRDIYLMKDYLFGKAEFTKYQRISADINKNGITDSVDMYMIKKYGSG